MKKNKHISKSELELHQTPDGSLLDMKNRGGTGELSVRRRDIDDN